MDEHATQPSIKTFQMEPNTFAASSPEEASLVRKLTEVQRSFELLLHEYNYLTSVLDSSNVLVVMADQSGQIIRFNRTFEVYFKKSMEGLSAKKIWELPQQDSQGTLFQNTIHNIEDYLRATQRETYVNSGTEQQRVISWSTQVFRDENDQIEYLTATGIDTTERRRVEKLLEHERLLLRSLLDSFPDLIFFKNRQGVYLGCNAAFEAFSHRSAALKTGGHTDVDLYPADLAKDFMATDQEILSGKSLISYEDQISGPDGSQLFLEIRKSPLYGPRGELLGVVGVGRDITKQKKDEQALQQANTEITQLIASISSILVVLSPELSVKKWNPSAERILGVSHNQALGQRLGNLDIRWDWNLISSHFNRCLKQGKTQYLDPTPYTRLDGTQGYLGININVIYDNNGVHSGFIFLGNDITERKSLQDQLVQAQKLQSIGQLAAGVAHEINTPIQYIGNNVLFLQDSFNRLLELIQSFSYLLEDARQAKLSEASLQKAEELKEQVDLSYLNEEIPSAIQQTLDGIQRVSEIVRAMKDFSHPGESKKTFVDINKALESTIAVARNEWKYVADMETNFATDLPQVLCCSGEINQVFLNIIVNAAQAIAEVYNRSHEMGTITISTCRDGEWIEVRIRDTGPGIPDAIRSRIFEPFFTTKEVGVGTGQGLAIAYSFIQVKHKGRLTFETALGKGTTFIIRLPIQDKDLAE